jgi:hypothetical protein
MPGILARHSESDLFDLIRTDIVDQERGGYRSNTLAMDCATFESFSPARKSSQVRTTISFGYEYGIAV